MTTSATRQAIAIALLTYRPGERVIPAPRLAAALGISKAAAWHHVHAAAQAAGVRLWRCREWNALVVTADTQPHQEIQ